MNEGDLQKAEMVKQMALKRAQWHADLVALMCAPFGKRIIAQFIEESRKRAWASEDRLTSYNLGRASVVNDFLDALRAADMTLFQATERHAQEKKQP